MKSDDLASVKQPVICSLQKAENGFKLVLAALLKELACCLGYRYVEEIAFCNTAGRILTKIEGQRNVWKNWLPSAPHFKVMSVLSIYL